MLIEEEIIDYQEHKQEIDKWISLKGEKKYLEFIKVLKNQGLEITWKKLDDAFRYDKRLLFNLFKYLSFFEDYLRAIVWNYSNKTYKKIEESYLKDVIDEVLSIVDSLNIKGFDINKIEENKHYINELRNRVSHNKIIINSGIDGKDYKEMINAFKETLPVDYQVGFIKEINNCSKGLLIDGSLAINL